MTGIDPTHRPLSPPLKNADGDRSLLPPPGPPAPPPQPSRPTPSPQHPSHGRRGGRAVALLAAATLAGSAGGFVAGGFVAGDTGSVQPLAQPVSIEASTGGIDVAAVVSAAQPSVVAIQTTMVSRQGPYVVEGTGAGTGVVLPDGYVLTNAHVVQGAREIVVTVAGESVRRTAEVVGADVARDLAVLRVADATGLVPATIGDSSTVAVGDPVVAIGNALGLGGSPTVTQGIVSALDRTIGAGGTRLSGMLQTDTAISSGNSGGPLLDADGAVIGINTAVAGSGGGVQASNVGFVIPIDDAMAFVDEVLRT